MIKTIEEVALNLIGNEVNIACEYIYDEDPVKSMLESFGYLRGVVTCYESISKNFYTDTDCSECEIKYSEEDENNA